MRVAEPRASLACSRKTVCNPSAARKDAVPLTFPGSRTAGAGNCDASLSRISRQGALVPNVEECLVHCQFLISKGRGQEAAKLVLPRLEAQRRKANKEGRTRLIRDLGSSVTYAEFNGEFDRYIEQSGGNPQIGYSIMLRLLKQLPNDSIKRLAEAGNEEP